MPLRRASHPPALWPCPTDLYVLVEVVSAVDCSPLTVLADCAALRSEHLGASCWFQKDEHSAQVRAEPAQDRIVCRFADSERECPFVAQMSLGFASSGLAPVACFAAPSLQFAQRYIEAHCTTERKE